MIIRTAEESDFDQVWDMFSSIIVNGDSFVFDSLTSQKDLRKYWFMDHMETYVIEENGVILGSYYIKPNQVGRGNHIANGGYMVNPNAHGKGIGRKLCEHSLRAAKESGYMAMQFNIVVSTNVGAVRLWEKFGFRIIGTTPNGFRHKTEGLVDTHIMYKKL